MSNERKEKEYLGRSIEISVCKSGLVTGKRPEPDWTRTC